jgi:hypothetical protein
MGIDSPSTFTGQGDIVLDGNEWSVTQAEVEEVLTGSPPNDAMFFRTHSIPSR